MACSCGKRKPRPRPGQNAQKPAPTGQSGQAGSGQTQQGRKEAFALQTRSGNVTTFGSKLEADAANARIGFTGTVRSA